MYIRDLMKSLLRRWYLVVAGILLTTALAAAAFVMVPVSYEAKGSVLLLPPKSSVGNRGNPYLYLGGLNQAMDVLSARINADDSRRLLSEAYPGAEFTTEPDATTTGPILVVTATSSDPREALTITQQLLGTIPTALDTLQDELSVTDQSRITVMNLTVDQTATPDAKTRTRAVIALAGVGAAGTVLLTGLIDGLLLSRRPRSAGPHGPQKRPEPVPDDGSWWAENSVGDAARPTITSEDAAPNWGVAELADDAPPPGDLPPSETPPSSDPPDRDTDAPDGDRPTSGRDLSMTPGHDEARRPVGRR